MVLGQSVEPLNSKESSERGAVPVSMLHHTSPELARESSYHKTAAGDLAQMQHRGGIDTEVYRFTSNRTLFAAN